MAALYVLYIGLIYVFWLFSGMRCASLSSLLAVCISTLSWYTTLCSSFTTLFLPICISLCVSLSHFSPFLLAMRDLFQTPLAKMAQDSSSHITDEDVRDLFGPLPAIYGLHSQIYAEMQTCASIQTDLPSPQSTSSTQSVQRSPSQKGEAGKGELPGEEEGERMRAEEQDGTERLAQLFCKYAKPMQVHVQYVQGYDKMLKALERMEKHKGEKSLRYEAASHRVCGNIQFRTLSFIILT